MTLNLRLSEGDRYLFLKDGAGAGSLFGVHLAPLICGPRFTSRVEDAAAGMLFNHFGRAASLFISGGFAWWEHAIESIGRAGEGLITTGYGVYSYCERESVCKEFSLSLSLFPFLTHTRMMKRTV